MSENGWESWSRFVINTLEKLDKNIEAYSKEATKSRESYLREILDIKAELRKEIQKLSENDILPLKIRVAILSLIFGGAAGVVVSIVTALIIHSSFGVSP